MSVIAQNISHFLSKHNMPITHLEKKARLKRNSIHSIISGRVKNPRIDTLVAIADALDCSIYELINEIPSKHPLNSQIQDFDLLASSFELLVQTLRKSNLNISYDSFANLLLETYVYSFEDSDAGADENFVNWLVSREKDKAA